LAGDGWSRRCDQTIDAKGMKAEAAAEHVGRALAAYQALPVIDG
jgi:hypothetical protein